MKRLLLILAALTAGLLSALPAVFDRAEIIRSVGMGMISDTSTIQDRLAAFAFHLGGWPVIEAVRLIFAAVPWFLGFLILFGVANLLKGSLRRWGFPVVLLLCMAASSWGVLQTIRQASRSIDDPRLLAPVTLVEMANQSGGRVFVNPSARPLVAMLGGRTEHSLSAKMIEDLGRSPEQWRAEDRSKPFSAVLIGGTVYEAKPLIRHLLDAPDWYLARVDNQGLLFLRGQKPDLAATPIPDFTSPRDRAVFLAQYALNLEAAGFRTLAASSMEEALSLAGKEYEVLFRAASLSASQSRWERARKQASAASKVRPGAYQADYLLALSLLETRAFDKGFECTTKLRRRYPGDPNVLLLHARACRAVHDYSEETKTLEQLLSLAERTKSPTAQIHVFLAQSWTQRGFPDQAISHYKSALVEGLGPQETRDVRAAIATIEDNRLKKQ